MSTVVPAQSTSVEHLRTLHGVGRLLVLPNAWDALSARLVESAGAEAVATSSAALAWALGYADGEELPITELAAAVRRMARGLRVPLTVDFERGYALDPASVAENVARIVDAGAVGVNLEDGAEDAAALAAKIAAVRERSGQGVFVNARTCIVLRGKVAPQRAAAEVLARARVFEAAGADGLFVPRLVDAEAIETIVRGTSLPLNVMLDANLPALADLRRLGVRRVSMGPQLAELAYGVARRAAAAHLERGECEALLGAELTYSEANAFFASGEA